MIGELGNLTLEINESLKNILYSLKRLQYSVIIWYTVYLSNWDSKVLGVWDVNEFTYFAIVSREIFDSDDEKFI